jgi:transcriptional regulator with XRE-family HTH domain
MSTLAKRVDAAILGSGKTAGAIARSIGITPDTVSSIRTGSNTNPTLQVLAGIAHETNTTVGALLGESIKISPEDENELLRFRGWIDDKLATIDARQEPNAIILSAQAMSGVRASRVADLPKLQRGNHPFGESAQLVLRAVGNSMIDAGILHNDTLYAIPTDSNTPASAVGKFIACSLGDDVFVKRLVSEHRRLFLLSSNHRYRPIAIDAKAEAFKILGLVVGRIGELAD